MASLCNFGVNELPDKSPVPVRLDGETRTEFDWRVRCMEINIREAARWDPAFRRKVDLLREAHTTDELRNAISELEWEQIGAERACWDNRPSHDAEQRLEKTMARLAALRLALEESEEEKQ
ncbi:MAG: hypothetical protein IJU44_05910 [Kiritimatiellae bacterium]|nr:hypothetical protein [Kiritimatiellia bacterium]